KSDNLLKHLLFDMNGGEYKRNLSLTGSQPNWNYDSDKYYTINIGFSEYILHFGDMSEYHESVLWLNAPRKDKTAFSFIKKLPSVGNIEYFGFNRHGYVEALEDGSYKLSIPEYWSETYSSVEVTMLSENVKNGTAYIERVNHELPEWINADSVKSIVFEDDIAFEIGSIEGEFGKNIDNNKRARSIDY